MVFVLPAAYRRRRRMTNMLERRNKEVKRRTLVATLFPNELSLLRFSSAAPAGTIQEWETGNTCLKLETA